MKVSSAVVHPTPIETPSFEPILTPEQVAERLQIKASTVYELTRRRSVRPMPVLKVGKYLRFRWSEVEQWLDEGRRLELTPVGLAGRRFTSLSLPLSSIPHKSFLGSDDKYLPLPSAIRREACSV